MRASLLLLLFFGIFHEDPFGECSSDEDDDYRPPEKRLKTTCYYENPITRSPLEKFPRDRRYEVSSGTCAGELHSMAELAENVDGNLYGATNEHALVVARGEGVYLDEYSPIDAWKDEVICHHHLNELSRMWFKDGFGHVRKMRGSGDKIYACGYPEENHSAQGKRTMSHTMSKNLLHSDNILVPPGTPLCDRHHKAIPKQSTQPRCSEFSSYTDAQGSVKSCGNFPSGPSSQLSQMSLDDLSSQGDNSCYEDESEMKKKKPSTEVELSLDKFLKLVKIDRAWCRKPFSELKPKNQKAKTRTIIEILQTIVGLLTDTVEEYEQVMAAVMEMLAGKSMSEDNEILHSMLTAVGEQYDRLIQYVEKRSLLSIFAYHVKYDTLAKYIPKLNRRVWEDARKAANSPVKVAPVNMRIRYDPVKIALFISFITSSHVMVGLPWGEKRTKDSLGNIIVLPNTIRLTGIYETIEMYETWAREYGHEPLSNSTTYKFLAHFPAIRSSSKTCVDYYQADATMGFLTIQQILKDLNSMNRLDTTETAQFKRYFDEFQVYLRTDYKLHVKQESRISDHCMVHALSDPKDKRFAADPKTDTHEHDRQCEMCEKMDLVFRDLEKRLTEWPENTGDVNEEYKLLDMAHDFRNAADKILDLKAHIVRTVFTSNEREIFIRGLQKGEAFITMDFAQRWLPSFFRETQKDFFGKNGYSWHVSHVYANVSGELVQHVFVHILKNEMQNGSVVVEIIKHMSEDLLKMGIHKLHLRSDNAGYYHSAAVLATIPSIETATGMKIATWSFSESQSGKSSSDRYASYSKTIMRAFMAKGTDIDTHERMYEALTSGKGLRGMSVHLATVGFTPQPKTKLNGISGLGHFEFNGDTISAWRFRGIGEGMKVSGLKGIDSSIQWHSHGGKLWRDGLKEEDEKKIADGEEPHYWFFPTKKVNTPEPDNVDDEVVTGIAPAPTSASDKNPLFICSKCSATFLRHWNLERHWDRGEHKIRPERVSMMDFALGLYKRMLEEVQQGVGIGPLSESFKEYEKAPKHPRPMGWALRIRKKSAPYDPVAKKMVVDLFEEFYAARNKLRAEEVEKRMKARTDIMPANRMSHDQIKNCIRTLLAKKKEEAEKKLKSTTRAKRDVALDMDFINDWEKEYDEEGGGIEDEVKVHEDDLTVSSDEIYNWMKTEMDTLFTNEAPDMSTTLFFDQ